MADSLWVDESGLRATVSELQRLADEGSRMLAALQQVVQQQQQPWGTDETGERFAENYVPDAQRGMQSLRELVSDLHGLSRDVAASADAFDQQDRVAGSVVARTTGDGGLAATPPATAWPTATTGVTASPGSATAGSASPEPAETGAPTAATAARVTAPGTDVAPAGARTGNETSSSGPDVGTANANRTGARPDSAQPGDSGSPDPAQRPNVTAPVSDSPATTETGRAGGDPAPAVGAVSAAADRPAAAQSGRTPDAAESRSGTPWSARGPNSSPWAKPAAAPPQHGSPPRVSPPRRTDRAPRPAGPKRAEREKVRAGRDAPAAPVADSEALRLVREAAARHGLELAGFDTSGIGVPAARELAAALDSVLPRCPDLLRGLDIAARPGARCRAERRDTLGAEAALWIVLEPAAVLDTALFREVTGVTEAVTAVCAARPLYAALVRAIGDALAISTGEQVRRRVQQALIAEYLRVSGAQVGGAQADSLGSVVTGYRRWRGGLGAACFDRGLLRPSAALGEGFAEVELCGDAASAAARVLHRLALSPTTAARRRPALTPPGRPPSPRPPTRRGPR
ncbi:hypothetical protein [Nocardia sp. alder85J]|uniref:hypothetical protein n=1 Tax=Nocardia sp. alder85J TaxID=2862949 RepID=UPI001CD3A043|nr:hypothetical protein [Nocardia sp. alder85J]MCX4093302.1 hypothetical protein [Nocardia sp. alder85J]